MTEESLRAYVEYGLRDRGDGVLRAEVPAGDRGAGVLDGPEPRRVRAPRGDRLATSLVVCGETSTTIGPPLAAEDREHDSRTAALEVMPGLGHFGPQQDPDVCVASILRFARVRPATPA